MLGESCPEIPLPRSWPRRIRSAVLQAISLAHYSLTCARARAAHNSNALVRLRQENDRLRQEVSLLGEEVRIKDARMERLPRPTGGPITIPLRGSPSWSCGPHGAGPQIRWQCECS
jgi:hypothetical protein